MIPTKEQLDALSRKREGSLQETPFALLLFALAVHERTVALEINRGQIRKRITVEYGAPVDCRSNLVHETLGRYLESQGKITAEQDTACFSQSVARSVPFGEILIEKGLITPQELYKSLQANLAKKLLDCFTWREGTFRLSFDVPAAESPLKVKVPQLIVTGISKFGSQAEVDAAIGPFVGKKLALNPEPLIGLDELRLSERQTKLLDALRARMRMDEMAASTKIGFGEMSRLLYAFTVIGLVVLADSLPLEPAKAPPPEPPPQPKPPEAAPAPDAARTEEVEKLRNDLLKAYLAYRKQDAFDLLGVPDEADTSVIQRRFLEFASRCAPWRFQQQGLKDLADKAQDLFLAGARAYARLWDDDARISLLSQRRAAREKPKTAPGDAYKIQTDLLDPAVQYRNGMGLLKVANYKAALKVLEFASDCDPQNGVYRAETARCRFLYSDLLASQCLRELEEALRIDPRCGLAAFYAGEISRATEAFLDAELYYKKAAALMPKDPRPAEGLKAAQSKSKKVKLA